MFGLIKKMFIRLLTSIASASNYAKYMLLSNQKCMTQPTFINSNPNEHRQELHYYPFVVKWGRFVGSCKALNNLSDKYMFQLKQKI